MSTSSPGVVQFSWQCLQDRGEFESYPLKYQDELDSKLHNAKPQIVRLCLSSYFGDNLVEITMLRPGKYIEVTSGTHQKRLVRRLRIEPHFGDTGLKIEAKNVRVSFQWAHQDIDTDQWIPFDDQDQFLIEQAFSRREKQYVLQGDGEDSGGALD
eukprot:PhF_6_TR4633/c0_g2_i1/m.6483